MKMPQKRAAEVFAETPYSALAEVTAKKTVLFQIAYTGSGDADTFDAAVKSTGRKLRIQRCQRSGKKR